MDVIVKQFDRDLLILDYQAGQSGYNSRDDLVQKEFAEFLRAFFGFLAIMVTIRAFGSFDRVVGTIIFLMVGWSGMVSMGALMVDIQANASCKKVLRKRGIEVEELLSPEGSLNYWRIINAREKYFEEAIFKRPTSERIEGSTASAFVTAARLMLLLWVTITILFVGFWEQVTFR